MTQQIHFGDCLNAGIKIAGVGALWGSFFSDPIPTITSNAVGSLVGVTAGNYMIHNTETGRKFEESTKCIIVIALSILVSTAVYSGFSMANSSLSIGKFAQGQLSSSLIAYFFGWGVVHPRAVEA